MSKKRGEGQYGQPTYNQASKVIAKFGGEPALALALGISRITVYRWGYARPYGTDGLIPSSAVERVQRAARYNGIVLTDADWRPERCVYPTEEGAS